MVLFVLGFFSFFKWLKNSHPRMQWAEKTLGVIGNCRCSAVVGTSGILSSFKGVNIPSLFLSQHHLEKQSTIFDLIFSDTEDKVLSWTKFFFE